MARSHVEQEEYIEAQVAETESRGGSTGGVPLCNRENCSFALADILGYLFASSESAIARETRVNEIKMKVPQDCSIFEQ